MKRYSSKFDRTLDDFISEESSDDAQRLYRPRSAHRSNYSRTSFQGVSKRSQREHTNYHLQRAHRFANTQESTQKEFKDRKYASPELTSLKIQIVNPNAKPKELPTSEVFNVSSVSQNSPVLTAETASQLVQDAILKTLPQLMSSMVQSQQIKPPALDQPSPNPGNPQVRVQSFSLVAPPVEFTSRSINEIFATISKSS